MPVRKPPRQSGPSKAPGKVSGKLRQQNNKKKKRSGTDG